MLPQTAPPFQGATAYRSWTQDWFTNMGHPQWPLTPRLAPARLFPPGAGSPTHILVPLLLACLHGQRLHFTLKLVHLHVQGVDGVLGERVSKGR